MKAQPKRGRLLRALMAIALVACGSRTGLLAAPPPEDDAGGPDATPDVKDAGMDADADAAEEDALPTIDVVHQDVQPPNDCPDADSTLVYVITEQNELYSFYPPTLAFTKIGVISCPGAGQTTPFSMAVDRQGLAYIVFTDGRLYNVSTATATCKSTSFQVGQHGFVTFGMGFSGDQNGESLYVSQSGNPSMGLATIDTTSLVLGFINPFNPSLPRGELTGTGDGKLFAFWPNSTGSGSHIAQIDPLTANVTGENNLQVGESNDAFAFAYWGGDFWIFTAPGGPSTVTRYDPQAQTETKATTLPSTIVGAGVSTCAPQ